MVNTSSSLSSNATSTVQQISAEQGDSNSNLVTHSDTLSGHFMHEYKWSNGQEFEDALVNIYGNLGLRGAMQEQVSTLYVKQ